MTVGLGAGIGAPLPPPAWPAGVPPSGVDEHETASAQIALNQIILELRMVQILLSR
jgi:hypothetical protein